MQIKSFPEDRRRYFKELNIDDLYRMPYSGMFAHPMLRFPDINYYDLYFVFFKRLVS